MSFVEIEAQSVVAQCFLFGIGSVVYVRRPDIPLSRRSIGVLFLMIFALQSVARLFLPQVGYLDSILKSGYQRNDPVTEYEARFDCIREGLPRNGVVGYTTSKRVRDDGRAFIYHYQVTQYTIAPLVLEDSIQKELVIGNLLDSLSLRGRLDDDGLVLIKDCGSGVALLLGRASE